MLKKFGILFLLVFAIGFAVDQFFRLGLSHNLNLKSSYVAQGGMNTDVLVEGPCESLFTIDPDYLQAKTGKKVYNLSLNHSDFADNYLHLHLYLQNNTAPEYILLFATPESFDKRFNTFHAYRFAPFLSDSVVFSTITDNDAEYSTWMHFPLLRYTYFGSQLTFPAIQGIKHWINGKKTPYLLNGHQVHESSHGHFYNPDKSTDSLQFDIQLDEFGNAPEDAVNKTFVWDSKRGKYFRKILALAQNNNIKLLVYESPGYLGILETQANRKEILKKIDAITAEYKSSYWIFDDLEISREKRNFICPLIMNSAASKDFMDTLSLKINKLK